jgi:RNA polymerase subunit RPABC4/transcription elongation factor Spt4
LDEGSLTPQYDTCDSCKGEVTFDSDFCPHCGVIFSAVESARCDTHTAHSATGVCIICRKLVCDECGKVVHHRTFCLEHRGVEVQQDWARIFQSSDINEAGLVRSVLQSAGFTVQVQNFSSIGFVWDGGGDSSLSRSALSKPAKVLVPIPEYIDAVKTLQEWNSGDTMKEEPDTEKT